MIQVYSTDTCGWCSKLKAYLQENHTEFEEIDITSSEENYNRLLSVSGQSGVPVTVFDSGEVVIGFDKPRLDRLLRQ